MFDKLAANKDKPVYKFFFRLALMIIPGLIIVFFLKNVGALKFSIIYAKPIYAAYKALLVISKAVLTVLGFDVSLIYSDKIYYYPVYALQTAKGDILFLGITCLGILLMLVFSALIIAYPGKILTKAWFIPLGCLVIQVLNVARIVVLTFLIDRYSIDINDGFNLFGVLKASHHDIFNFVILIVIFIMFSIYTRRFAAQPAESKPVTSGS